MSYQIILWVLFVAILIVYSIVRKKGNKKLNVILFALMLLIFLGQIFLPWQFLGKWNSISGLDGKEVTRIILRPSEPEWEVNLVSKDYIISEKQQIDSLIYLLRRTEVYSSNHPIRIWEASILFTTIARDTFEIEVNQTKNNGSVIYTPTNEWRNDKLGSYLERITKYARPLYGDTSTLIR